MIGGTISITKPKLSVMFVVFLFEACKEQGGRFNRSSFGLVPIIILSAIQCFFHINKIIF